MKIEVGKRYRTRGGKIATVYSKDDDKKYMFNVGFSDGELETWTRQGKVYEGEHNEYDAVECIDNEPETIEVHVSEWQSKVWGRTRCLVDSEFYSLHELECEAGGYCSWHYHHHRANKFTVKSGAIEVVELFGPEEVVHVLRQDEELIVHSLVVHQFRVLESGIVWEEYFPDRGGKVSNSDIARLMVGGKIGGGVESFDWLLPMLMRGHMGGE